MQRGSAKTAIEYLAGIEKLYKEHEIDKEDYLAMIGAARVAFFGESEDDIWHWIEEQMDKGEENELLWKR